MGQGGFTCHQFVEAIGEPVTVALRSPIPLETGLDVVHLDDCWHLVDPSDPGTVILEATRWDVDYPSTNAVTIEEAAVAREAFRTASAGALPRGMSSTVSAWPSMRTYAFPQGYAPQPRVSTDGQAGVESRASGHDAPSRSTPLKR